jgi:hypothetical protein
MRVSQNHHFVIHNDLTNSLLGRESDAGVAARSLPRPFAIPGHWQYPYTLPRRVLPRFARNGVSVVVGN